MNEMQTAQHKTRQIATSIHILFSLELKTEKTNSQINEFSLDSECLCSIKQNTHRHDNNSDEFRCINAIFVNVDDLCEAKQTNKQTN